MSQTTFPPEPHPDANPYENIRRAQIKFLSEFIEFADHERYFQQLAGERNPNKNPDVVPLVVTALDSVRKWRDLLATPDERDYFKSHEEYFGW